MEAAPVKGKPEWRSFDVGLEEVQHNKSTWSICVGSFFVGLLDGDVGSINSDDLEALLREPNCVVASAASDLQRLAWSDWQRGDGLNEVEIGLANVPRRSAFFVCLPEMIFD
jgi:hypothetical protein